LEQWQEPIDIIFAFFPPVLNEDFSSLNNTKNDQILQNMQEFYLALSRIAKEVVILIENIPYFDDVPIYKVAAQFKSGKAFQQIGGKRKVNLNS
jgi:hypothetical protein